MTGTEEKLRKVLDFQRRRVLAVKAQRDEARVQRDEKERAVAASLEALESLRNLSARLEVQRDEAVAQLAEARRQIDVALSVSTPRPSREPQRRRATWTLWSGWWTLCVTTLHFRCRQKKPPPCWRG
jgi:hypothetical protein